MIPAEVCAWVFGIACLGLLLLLWVAIGALEEIADENRALKRHPSTRRIPR